MSTLYAVYKPKEITDSEFVQVYFELDSRMNSYMHPLVNKGAKNDMKVSAENALKGNVMFPHIKEQKQISAYFHTLDNLITLHRRKCKICKFFSENDWLQRKLRNSWFRVIEAHRDKLILLKRMLKTILIVLKIIRIMLFIAKEITEWLN